MGQFPYASIPEEFEKDDATASFMEDMRKLASQLQIVGDRIFWRSGTSSPEGVITARPGSLYTRTDGPPTLYVKESGIDSFGWVAK